MKECECLACERVVLTSNFSERFVYTDCLGVLVAIYAKYPQLKPKQDKN